MATIFRQVSVAEAAALLGCSADTVKRRVRRGALQSSRTPQGRVLITLPEAVTASHEAPQLQGSDGDEPGLLARMTVERDWLRDRVERAESEREQLRVLLSNAQHSLVRALQAAPQTAQESSLEPSGSPEAPDPPSAPWWIRWRALAPWLLLLAVILAVVGVWH